LEKPVKIDRLVSPRRSIQPKYCENAEKAAFFSATVRAEV
jgi:hypothetical protein